MCAVGTCERCMPRCRAKRTFLYSDTVRQGCYSDKRTTTAWRTYAGGVEYFEVVKFKMRVIFITLIMVSTLMTSVVANGYEDGAVTQGLQEIEREIDFETGEILSMSPNDLFNGFIDGLADQMSGPFILLVTVIAVLFISTLAQSVVPMQIKNGTDISGPVDTVINIVVFLVLLTPILSIQGELSEVIYDCKRMIDSFLMVFISLLAAGGQVGTAAATGFFSGAVFVVSELIVNAILPLVAIYLSLKSCSLCVNTVNFSGMAEIVRKGARYILLGTASVFTAVIGMQSLIASAADNLALRTGKFIVSAGVPIIGSAIQEAITTVIGGVTALKTTAGITAILGVVLMFAPLLMRCIAYLLIFSLCGVAAEIANSKKACELLRSAAHSMEIFFSCIVLFCLMLTLSILTFMLSGGVIN